jgi:hypothetical protein
MSSTKNGSRVQPPIKAEEPESAPKPLTATLFQEFQNLKDKFKNEDDVQEKGITLTLIINQRKKN